MLELIWDNFEAYARPRVPSPGPQAWSGPGAQVDHLDHESRKRLFWCAYNLDKTLSTILGRPCALRDCDIDQDLPNVVDDQDLSSTCIVVAESDNMHVMLGMIHN
ncbi:hypothetical protein V2G26_013507 [Clonostachys chloroleuca]